MGTLLYSLGLYMGVMIFYTRVDGTRSILGVWVYPTRHTYKYPKSASPLLSYVAQYMLYDTRSIYPHLSGLVSSNDCPASPLLSPMIRAQSLTHSHLYVLLCLLFDL